MSIAIALQTTEDESLPIAIRPGGATILATSGVAGGGDTVIKIKSEAEGWSPTGKVLDATTPTHHVFGPVTIKLFKAVSSSAYAVEVMQDKASDLTWQP